jgi:hypothetical protein
MERFESAAYVPLGFIPILSLLEIANRMGMKIRRKKGVVIGRGILPPTKSLLPIVFRT